MSTNHKGTKLDDNMAERKNIIMDLSKLVQMWMINGALQMRNGEERNGVKIAFTYNEKRNSFLIPDHRIDYVWSDIPLTDRALAELILSDLNNQGMRYTREMVLTHIRNWTIREVATRYPFGAAVANARAQYWTKRTKVPKKRGRPRKIRPEATE